MIINETTINEYVDGILDYIVAEALGYNAVIKCDNDDIPRCYVDNDEFKPSSDSNFILEHLIPTLVHDYNYCVSINYDVKYVECIIINVKEKFRYSGYGNDITDATCRAFALLTLNNKTVELKYDIVLH